MLSAQVFRHLKLMVHRDNCAINSSSAGVIYGVVNSEFLRFARLGDTRSLYSSCVNACLV